MKVNLLIDTNDICCQWCYCHTNGCSLKHVCICNCSDCVIFLFSFYSVIDEI